MQIGCIVWQDMEGSTGPSYFHNIPDSVTIEQLTNLSQALETYTVCNNNYQSLTKSTIPEAAPGGPGSYHNIEDKMKIYLQGSDGNRYTLTIPGPKADNFESDGESVRVETGEEIANLLSTFYGFTMVFQRGKRIRTERRS